MSLTLFDERILQTVMKVHSRTLLPVKTMTLVLHLEMYDRTLRLHLVRLEQLGKVQRVGKRGGWLPAGRVGLGLVA